MLSDVLERWGGREVSALDLYTDIFHLGEGVLQREGESAGKYKANPIGYWKNGAAEHGHFRVMFEDTFEESLREMQKADFSLLNCVTYFGRRRDQNHASKLFALIFDLDGVGDTQLNAFFNAAYKQDFYPIPNYLILSGNGVHLYYVFKDPVPLFPFIKLQLKTLKHDLTTRIWNPYTSDYDERGLKIEYQGIYQAFRVPGGHAKKNAKEKVLRAFKMNDIKYTLEMLGKYVPEESRVDETKLFKESKMSLDDAAAAYPDWYEKVILNKDRTPTRWDIKGKVHGDNPYALYDWWKKKIKEGATYKHRYFSVMCLVIYGVKNDVPYEQVEKDALSLVPFLNDIHPEDPFTESDVRSALECYDLSYCTFPIDSIKKITQIEFGKNKRNYRSQEKHLSLARASKFAKAAIGENVLGGRPHGSGSKEHEVVQYMQNHPEASVKEVAEALRISRTTVYKHKDKATDFVSPMKKVYNNNEYDEMRIKRLQAYQQGIEKIKKDK